MAVTWVDVARNGLSRRRQEVDEVVENSLSVGMPFLAGEVSAQLQAGNAVHTGHQRSGALIPLRLPDQVADDRDVAVGARSAARTATGSADAYPAMTCVYSPREDEATVATDGQAEMFLVELPRLD